MSEVRAIITNKDHPHFGERGVFTGKVIKPVGKSMAELKLDSCIHGTKACFVKQVDCKIIT